MEGIELSILVRQVERVVRSLKDAQRVCKRKDHHRGNQEEGDHWFSLEGCSDLKREIVLNSRLMANPSSLEVLIHWTHLNERLC